MMDSLEFIYYYLGFCIFYLALFTGFLFLLYYFIDLVLTIAIRNMKTLAKLYIHFLKYLHYREKFNEFLKEEEGNDG